MYVPSPVNRGLTLATAATIAVLAATAGAALATPLQVCVPNAEGAAIVTPKAGSCKAKYTATTLLPQEDQEKLEAILPYIEYEASGINEKPTIQISGANLQVVDGEGKTEVMNGAGNVIIGYDEGSRHETGSHNLVLGVEQSYSSYGSLLGGYRNNSMSPFTALFGENNRAAGLAASAIGGFDNQALGERSSVTGGEANTAAGEASTVSGGQVNDASGLRASISGGKGNDAQGENASVSAGRYNEAEAPFASVSGGISNHAAGTYSSILGGKELTATEEYETIP
jgi:hypothetical protein